MNTRFGYYYADGHNYKEFQEVILEGEFSLDQIQPLLFEGDFFVPCEIGLDDLQDEPYLACDHVWHQLHYAELTEDAPNVALTAERLIERFRQAKAANWDTPQVTKRMWEVSS